MATLQLFWLLIIHLVASQDITIPNGVVRCQDESCLVFCDYGFVPTDTYHPPLDEALLAECESAVALVVGGYNRGPSNHDSSDQFLESAEVFSLEIDGDGGCDGRMKSLPYARKGMVGGWVDGVAIVCGGEDSDGVVFSDCIYYTPKHEEEWSYLGEMEVPRTMAAGTVIEGCLVISGGKTNGGEALDTVEVVGLNGCTWSGRIQKLPSARYGHCLVEVGVDLITIGGGPNSYDSSQAYSLDSWQESGWRDVASPGKSRYGHSCSKLIVDGVEAVLVAGNNFSPPDLSEIYFPQTDSWIWTEYMKAERDGAGMIVMGNHPTMIGGYGGDICCKEYHQTAEAYNGELDSWDILPLHNMTEGRKNHLVFQVPSTAFCR